MRQGVPPVYNGRKSSRDDLCLLHTPKEKEIRILLIDTQHKKEEKRTNIIHELVTTEINFLNILGILEEYFKGPLIKYKILSEIEIGLIFSNLHEIRKLQWCFFKQLQKILSECKVKKHDLLFNFDETYKEEEIEEQKKQFLKCKTLEKLFLNYANTASIFSEFCSTYSTLTSSKIIQNFCETNKKFNLFLKVRRSINIPRGNKLK